MEASTILIDRLNDLVAAGEMSRSGLARAAGLHPNSLRSLDEEDWNPTAETLKKPIDWAELFGNSNPVEMEIGSGKGTFLTEQAKAEDPKELRKRIRALEVETSTARSGSDVDAELDRLKQRIRIKE